MEPLTALQETGHISALEIIMGASPAVQAVMAILALASVASWGIVLEKAIQLSAMARQIRILEEGSKAAAGAAPSGGWLLKEIIMSGHETAPLPGESFAEHGARMERAMHITSRAYLQGLKRRIRLLATIGATAPFVGLFGTVWGIMNSFSAIAHQKDTSLATVAPGIAEALFATALGLAAAIPAVIAYNQIAGAIVRQTERIALAIARLSDSLLRGQAARGRP